MQTHLVCRRSFQTPAVMGTHQPRFSVQYELKSMNPNANLAKERGMLRMGDAWRIRHSGLCSLQGAMALACLQTAGIFRRSESMG
jgi:hypothetical protein